MRLTAELIHLSPQFVNTLNDRELDMRGNKIAVIENLGATRDQFDTIDLSDNEIRQLTNFPILKRLVNLYLNNNRLSYIDPACGDALPNLESLIMTNNAFREFHEIMALSSFKKLMRLSLLDNPVCKKDNYRYYVIHLVPTLKYLDFKKVKPQERKKAKELFAGKIERVPGLMVKKNVLTPEQKEKIMNALRKATSIQEINKYEEALKNGRMPENLMD